VLALYAGAMYFFKRDHHKLTAEEFNKLIEAKVELINQTAVLQVAASSLGKSLSSYKTTMDRVIQQLQPIENHYNRIIPRGVCRNILNLYLDHFRMSVICWYHKNSCPAVCNQPQMAPAMAKDQIADMVGVLHQEMIQQLSGTLYADGKSLSCLVSVSMCQDVVNMLQDQYQSGRPFHHTSERLENYIGRVVAKATEELEQSVQVQP
jgi:hypothetical protein